MEKPQEELGEEHPGERECVQKPKVVKSLERMRARRPLCFEQGEQRKMKWEKPKEARSCRAYGAMAMSLDLIARAWEVIEIWQLGEVKLEFYHKSDKTYRGKIEHQWNISNIILFI